eukprot:tig00000093_g3550.t1
MARPDRRHSAASDETDLSDGKRERRAAEAAGGTSDIISILTRRYLIAFVTIALIAAANFLVCFLFMENTQYAAAYIREAGNRWGLVTELHLWGREVYVNDWLIRSTPAVLRRLHAATLELTAVQMDLIHGNVTEKLPPALARYPAQDFLLFEEKCLHAKREDCRPGEVSNMAAVTSGVDYMLQVVMHTSFGILQEFGYFTPDGRVDEGRLAELEAEGPRPDYAIDAILQRSAPLRGMIEIDGSGNLDEALTRSMEVYQRMASEKIDTVMTVESYILALNVVFIVGLYLFVFRSVVNRLKAECTRTTQFVSMLPAQVIAQVPALHKYAGTDEARGDEP